MNIDISLLSYNDCIDIDENYSFTLEELKDSEIMKLDDVKVTGNIIKNSLNEYILNATVKGVMVLPCSVSLKPVEHSFECKIEENLDKMSENLQKNQKTIDILPIIWENILMEVPIKVVSSDLSDVKTSGDGWDFITED